MRRSRAAAALALLVLAAGCSTDPAAPPAAEPSTATPPSRSAGAPAREAPDPLRRALAGTPERPRSPAQAAATLRAADRVLARRSSSPRLLAAAGHSQQLALAALAERPGWDGQVAPRLAPGLRRTTAAEVTAQRAFRSMHPDRPRDLAAVLPAWRIVAPPPAAELRGWYREAERRFGVDWEYLAAINLVETRFGRIRGTSVAGAQGPMQFVPGTWELYGAGGDVRDPRDAILAAGRLLRANGFAGDPAGALRHYNNSGAYVRGVTLYARVMQRRPWAYRGFHQWQVYYLTRAGSVWLPEGYAEREPVPVRAVSRHDGVLAEPGPQ